MFKLRELFDKAYRKIVTMTIANTSQVALSWSNDFERDSKEKLIDVSVLPAGLEGVDPSLFIVI